MARAIISDGDDTLFATYPTTWPVWARSARDFGFVLDEVIFKTHWGKPGVPLVAKSLGIPEELAKQIYERQIEYAKDVMIPAIPGAPQTLKVLAASYVLGAVSSRSQLYKTPPDCYPSRNGKKIYAAIEYRLDAAGIDTKDFIFIHGREDCEFLKPDPKVFTKAAAILGQQGIGMHEVLYVGDSLIDYEAACNAGLQFVGVLTGVHTLDDFVAAGCPAQNIIPSIAELPEYLKK